MKRKSSVIPAFIETHPRDLSLQFPSQGSLHPERATRDISAHVRSVPQAVSVIIPTLNEAANMADLLARIHQSLTAASLSYEVIVIDDHSTDETIAVVQAVAKEHALPVRILTKQGKVGKSYSLLEGFAMATFDVLAMIDGDLQYPPEALPVMAQMLTHSDIVVADRGITYGVADGLRGLMSQAFRTLTKLFFGINTDMQSGLKMFRHTIYEKIRCFPGRWSFDLYLVTHAVFHGYRLTNVPIKFHDRQRGISKVAPLKVGMELLLTALLLKANRSWCVIAGRMRGKVFTDVLHYPKSADRPRMATSHCGEESCWCADLAGTCQDIQRCAASWPPSFCEETLPDL